MKYEIKTPEDDVETWPKFSLTPINERLCVKWGSSCNWLFVENGEIYPGRSESDLRILPPGTTITITV